MKRDVLILTPLFFFLLGVAVCSLMVFFTLMSLLVILAALVWLLATWQEWGPGQRGGRAKLLAFLALCGFLAGGGRFLLDQYLSCLPVLPSSYVSMLIRVQSLPERDGQEQTLIGEVLAVGADDFSGGGMQPRLLVRLPFLEQVDFGERLLIKGRLVASGAEQGLSEKMRQKLYRLRLAGLLEDVRLEQRLGKDLLVPFSFIFNWRNGLLKFFSAVLTEPAASLVSGVLLGERSSLPVSLARAFQITGLTHILAISGFNITLIINLLIVVTAYLPRVWRLPLTGLIISLFVLLTGASASVVRAAVMGMLIFSVKSLGRRVSAFKAIVLSVSVIVFFDPRLLALDISFQLSVLATLSLVLFAGSMQLEYGQHWQKLIWDGMATTLAAQVITLPYLCYHFGTVSLIAPVANLLIGPLIPLLMLLGTGVWVVSFLPGPLLLLLAGLTQLLVVGMTSVIDFLAAVPLAQLEIGQGLLWPVLLYYPLLIIVSRKYRLVPDWR